jgi:ATP-dependent 26S proteasome regulatory subunit
MAFDEVKFQQEAREAAKLRAAGTHVFCSQKGVIPIREARDMIRRGDAAKGDFKGDPNRDGQPVDWTKAGGLGD